MKRFKNRTFSTSIQDHEFLMDILKGLCHGISYRFVIQISFLILPILSYGQIFQTDTNSAPLVGLEHVYVEQHQKIAPGLFITSNTIITKSAGTTFFVNGLIQMDTLFEISSEVKSAIVAKPKGTHGGITLDTNPASEIATTEVQKNSYQPALPAFPWNKNPLQQETFFASVIAVSVLTKHLRNKKDNTQFQLHQSCANLLHIPVKTEGDATYSTFSVTNTFGKNATEFSSRPPPVSKAT